MRTRDPRFFRDHARDYKGYLSAGKLVGMRRSPEPGARLPGISALIQQWATSLRKIATHEAVRPSVGCGSRKGRRGRKNINKQWFLLVRACEYVCLSIRVYVCVCV